MTALIISAISLLIIFPIIYFIPLNITKIGKVLLSLLAFLFANVGLLARDMFELWQIGLILLLLVFLTVYIFDKRFGKHIYITESPQKRLLEPFSYQEDTAPIEDEEFIFQEVAATIEDDFFEEENFLPGNDQVSINHGKPINIEKDEQLIDLSIDLNKNEEKEPLHENNEIDIKESFIENYEENEKNETSFEVEDSDNLEIIDIDDEISFLSDRQMNLEKEEDLNEIEIQSDGYLSEIEKLLESDSVIESDLHNENEKDKNESFDIETSRPNLFNEEGNEDTFDFDMLLAEKRTTVQESEKD